ncbi:MAG: hypothetical protein PVI66_15000 [Candidatus Aminicenantes bacterium]|jgi:hypothetical protein
MTKYKTKPLSPERIKTYSLKKRKSKVDTQQFGKVLTGDETISSFVDSLPDILAGKDFKNFAKKVKAAKAGNKPIIFAMGAHVIKVGLNPLIIDLMRSGWISALALNGAGIIHDFEIAYAGQTSEDVSAQIKDGRFGMAKETGEILNRAIAKGSRKKLGLGESVGAMISASDFSFKDLSLLSCAYELGIPVTVHVALGTDIIHCHPEVDGAAVGKTSLHDFFLFCALVEKLEGGGVFINIGSAVVLPEVFLKAVSSVRNRGKSLDKFSTAVFDFNLHYRPSENVVRRPLKNKKDGFYFIGHHEIMIPLLVAILKSSSV